MTSIDLLGLVEWQVPNTEKMEKGKCYYQICKTTVAKGVGTHTFILLYDNIEGVWYEFRGGPSSRDNFGSISASDGDQEGLGTLLGTFDVLGGKHSCEHPSTSGQIPQCTLVEIPNCMGNSRKINQCFRTVIQKINSLGVVYKPVPSGIANITSSRLNGNCNTLSSLLQDVCVGKDKTVWQRPGFSQPGDKELTFYYQKLLAAIKNGFPRELLPQE